MKTGDILLVDDDLDHLHLLRLRLEREGYRILTATHAREALTKVSTTRPRLVITDLRMADMDGLALLDALQRQYPTLPVLMISAHGTIPDAVEAMQRGAFGFVTKPIEREDLLNKVERALATYAGDHAPLDSTVVTCSDRMRSVLEEARLAAASELSVLIKGPTGSGKELIARYIHDQSPRAKGPWVAVNCAAIPQELLESELFGHHKGAFAGADDDRTGLIAAAQGGTLFLDEIGDLPLALQAKVLQVLEERRIRAQGAQSSQPVDIRLVAATHCNLEQAIADGEFREDLYYRLNVVQLKLPALVERREDIPLLVHHFLEQIAAKSGKRLVYAPEAMELLVRAPWPGNVRQLKNLVERHATLSRTPVIPAQQVQEALAEKVAELPSYDEARDSFTREYLIQLLKMTGGNVSQAARLAQRNRTDFYKLLNRHGIEKSQF